MMQALKLLKEPGQSSCPSLLKELAWYNVLTPHKSSCIVPGLEMLAVMIINLLLMLHVCIL